MTQSYIDAPIPGGGTHRVELDEATVAWMAHRVVERKWYPFGNRQLWCIGDIGVAWCDGAETRFSPCNTHMPDSFVARWLECALRDVAHTAGLDVDVCVESWANDKKTTGLEQMYWAEHLPGGKRSTEMVVPLAVWLYVHKREKIPGGPYDPKTNECHTS